LDTADTLTINNGDLDVTTLTPGWAPRVLNEVVFLTILNTVTNGENTVIKTGTTFGAVKNTT